MEINEAAGRVVIAKPVASKPSCSTFRSFSELLAGAINDDDSSPPRAFSETAVAPIRPKTVRVTKHAASHASAGLLPSCSQSQAEVFRAAASGQSLDTLLVPDTNSTVVYKPLAKVVSKSTVTLLANMGNFNRSPQQQAVPPVEPQPQQLSRPQGLYLRSHQRPKNVIQSLAEPSRSQAEASRRQSSFENSEEEPKSIPTAVANVDRPSYDGYNWRKYGQKQVKGSEYPRSYYKCTHPNCPVKKKVERSFDGQITEIVYKGEHNHLKPQPPKKNTPAVTAQANESEGTGQDFSFNNNVSSSQFVNDARNQNSDRRTDQNQNEMMRLSAVSAYPASKPVVTFDNAANAGLGMMPDSSCGASGEHDDASKGIDADYEEPKSKRRKSAVQQSDQAGPSGDGVQVPKIVVQSSTDTEVVGDGYRWRKYGQKVVKGNPYPRSYYRCTSLKCNVRKHIERASEDPGSFITTYEGKHNHEMPAKSAAQAASEQGSQTQASKDKK